jgi:hypothetical protein
MRCDSIEKLQALRLEITCANAGFHRNAPMVMCYGRIVAHPQQKPEIPRMELL